MVQHGQVSARARNWHTCRSLQLRGWCQQRLELEEGRIKVVRCWVPKIAMKLLHNTDCFLLIVGQQLHQTTLVRSGCFITCKAMIPRLWWFFSCQVDCNDGGHCRLIVLQVLRTKSSTRHVAFKSTMVMGLVAGAVHCLHHGFLCSPQGCRLQHRTPLVIDVLGEGAIGTLDWWKWTWKPWQVGECTSLP